MNLCEVLLVHGAEVQINRHIVKIRNTSVNEMRLHDVVYALLVRES